MLADRKQSRDFEGFVDYLQQMDRKLDHRYKASIDRMQGSIQDVASKIDTEVKYRELLEKYKKRGFNVRAFLTKRYHDFRRLEAEIKPVLDNLKELERIHNAYNAKKSQLSHEARRKFESIAFDPTKILEIKSLWHKLKTRGQ